MTAVAVEAETEVSLGFKVPRSVMFSLLTKALAVVPTSDNLEVLKHFQLRAEGGKLTVASTDTQLAVMAVASLVEIETEGVAVFPAVRLIGLVKEAADGDIEFSVTGREADIRSGHATWSLKLADPKDFPALPVFEEFDFAPIPRTDLVLALNATRAAVSQDAMRPNLNIVSVKSGSFESSDGVRYHRVSLSSDIGDVQIPANALDDLLALLQNSEASEVLVGQDSTLVAFRLGEDVYTAQKLVATFPDMEKAILKPAQANKLELKVDRLELMAAVRRVRVTADAETSAVTMSVEDKSLDLVTKDRSGSWGRESLPCAWTGTESMEVTVNHRHLLEALGVVTADTVSLMLGAGTKTKPAPILVQSPDTVALAVLSQLRKEFTG